MPRKALLDSFEDGRRLTIHHEVNGRKYVETRQDCDHIVRAAKILADQPPGKDFRHVGFIPDAVLNQMFIDGSFSDPSSIRKWLNDPQNAEFRTWKGRV